MKQKRPNASSARPTSGRPSSGRPAGKSASGRSKAPNVTKRGYFFTTPPARAVMEDQPARGPVFRKSRNDRGREDVAPDVETTGKRRFPAARGRNEDRKPFFGKGVKDGKLGMRPRGKPAFRTPEAKPTFTRPALASPAVARKEAYTRKDTRKTPREALPPSQGVMLWGVHAVREAWMNPKRSCFKLYVTEAGCEAMQETLDAASNLGLRRPDVVLVDDRQAIDRLLPPNSVHQGIALDVALLPDMRLDELLQSDAPPDLIIVLDQVTDPHNVGAILRSACAFNAGAVILTERNAPTTTGSMAKTASGAAEHVPQIHVVNLARALTELQQAGYWCVGLAEQGERDLGSLDLSGRTALVLGAEGDGLRRLTRDHCDELARLPTSGAIGSLNVSNAAAIALYEARKQKAKF